MSRRSASPFAAPESARRSSPEIILGRHDTADITARLAELRERDVELSVSALRRDDRPAGRMTLLPAG